jgi:hypothetical protein
MELDVNRQLARLQANRVLAFEATEIRLVDDVAQQTLLLALPPFRRPGSLDRHSQMRAMA